MAFSDLAAHLRAFGVPVSDLTTRCATIDEVIDAIKAFESSRLELGYGVDGMVVRTYRTTDFLEQRRVLMERWASHLRQDPKLFQIAP